MAEIKTKPSDLNVEDYLNSIDNEKRKNDSFEILKMMNEITGIKPQFWAGMVGYGNYHYKYASGHEGDAFMIGFAPRKQNLVVYIMTDFEKFEDLYASLGKFKTGKCCLYINKLDDVKRDKLKELITLSFENMKVKYNS